MNFNFMRCKTKQHLLRKGNLYYSSVRNIETAPSKKLLHANESFNSDYHFKKFNTVAICNYLWVGQ